MATIKRFEDLEVWQIARELNIKITPIFNKLNEDKSYKLKNQLDRSSGSVMDNIAEGFERDGNRELIQFLAIAKGSLGEVRSQLYRIFDRNFIEKQYHDLLQEDCLQLGSKLGKFISYLNNSTIKGNKFKNQTKT
jgi:four helix bundle protein